MTSPERVQYLESIDVAVKIEIDRESESKPPEDSAYVLVKTEDLNGEIEADGGETILQKFESGKNEYESDGSTDDDFFVTNSPTGEPEWYICTELVKIRYDRPEMRPCDLQYK